MYRTSKHREMTASRFQVRNKMALSERMREKDLITQYRKNERKNCNITVHIIDRMTEKDSKTQYKENGRNRLNNTVWTE